MQGTHRGADERTDGIGVLGIIYCPDDSGLGIIGVMVRRNFITVLMSLELVFNAVNLNLVGFSRFVESPNPIDGHVFAIFVITVAAAEAAVALALDQHGLDVVQQAVQQG